MPAVYVCPLSQLDTTVEESGAEHVITLIDALTPVERPTRIAADNHLFLGFNDINQPMEGMIPPGEDHVRQLLDYVRGWDRQAPIVIHCWAGISRSTAGAFITLCALAPEHDEFEMAAELRNRSPIATPNARLVALADNVLRRDGRMREAIAGIGRGRNAFEGEPFHIPVR